MLGQRGSGVATSYGNARSQISKPKSISARWYFPYATAIGASMPAMA